MIQPGGGVTRNGAAVCVGRCGSLTNAVRQVTSRSPEELDKLKKIVQSALGSQEGQDSTRKDEITLEEFEFNGQPGAEIATTLHKEQTFQFWLNIAQTAAYPLLALGLMAMLYR